MQNSLRARPYLEVLPEEVLHSGSEVALNAVSISLNELNDSLSRNIPSS